MRAWELVDPNQVIDNRVVMATQHHVLAKLLIRGCSESAPADICPRKLCFKLCDEGAFCVHLFSRKQREISLSWALQHAIGPHGYARHEEVTLKQAARPMHGSHRHHFQPHVILYGGSKSVHGSPRRLHA